MKKTKFFLIVVFIAVFSATAGAENNLKVIEAKGSVNIAEVGGDGLRVFSLWDKAEGVCVGPDGSFSTLISGSAPQKLAVRDSKRSTRALMMILPEKGGNTVIDAESTATAILFSDPQLLRKSESVEKYSGLMRQNKSFQELAAFLRKNLPLKSLEELADNPQCTALLEKCNEEIFGEDQLQVKKSLHEAEGKLRNYYQ